MGNNKNKVRLDRKRKFVSNRYTCAAVNQTNEPKVKESVFHLKLIQINHP